MVQKPLNHLSGTIFSMKTPYDARFFSVLLAEVATTSQQPPANAEAKTEPSAKLLWKKKYSGGKRNQSK
jgi:cytochrome c556